MLTGAAAAEVSTMTDGAAAVIPEVLAGQILSLARRGRGGHTVLAASNGAGDGARDRLVVLLQPIVADGDESSENSVRSSGGKTDGGRNAERDAQEADERPRHALVVSCAPGQVRISSCAFRVDIVAFARAI